MIYIQFSNDILATDIIIRQVTQDPHIPHIDSQIIRKFQETRNGRRFYKVTKNLKQIISSPMFLFNTLKTMIIYDTYCTCTFRMCHKIKKLSMKKGPMKSSCIIIYGNRIRKEKSDF